MLHRTCSCEYASNKPHQVFSSPAHKLSITPAIHIHAYIAWLQLLFVSLLFIKLLIQKRKFRIIKIPPIFECNQCCFARTVMAAASSVVVTLLTKPHVATSRSSPRSAAFSTSTPQLSFQSLDSVHLQLGSSFKNGRLSNPLIKKSLSLHKNHSAPRGMERRCPRSSAYPFSWENISDSSLYALLGVQQSVEIPELKRAYRKMALRYHPDACPTADVAPSTEKFLQLQNAYKVLSDPELRKQYDRHMANFFYAGNYRKSGNRGSEVVKEHWVRQFWKPQWETQLGKLRRRHAASGHEASQCSTWGVRMRYQNKMNYGAF
ncbi:hypothetical protein O6H91_02G014500 [Diphasiastrum complanatum]|uniref:Uncharacterized protein n=1 Tax=Diphasiastrum complanatum TaxID=34168 RepID=A0ACC2ECU3_DIPCM|nr:hypothetical protein O6H91_02G014500 [Diphasiastrum complanatum]